MKQEKIDVAIIGGGVTGLSTAMHLLRQGCGDILLIAPRQGAASWRSGGFFRGGQTDNFTRFSHARGPSLAGDIWRFGHSSFEALAVYLQNNGLAFKKGFDLRMATSQAEDAEMQVAVKDLNAQGFHASYAKSLPSELQASISLKGVFAVQTESHAGFCDTEALGQSLEHETRAVRRFDEVVKLDASGSGARLTLKSGAQLDAEMCVLAAHLASGSLFPDLREILISYADQWLEMEAEGFPENLIGSFFALNFGYVWGWLPERNRLCLGGARYIRKWAGFEATEPTVEENVTKALLAEAARHFPEVNLGKMIRAVGLLECRPCDELPLIGPLPSASRLLIGTGFMGQGLAMGFWAGKCLSDIILNGRSTALPDIFLPARLRSLGN